MKRGRAGLPGGVTLVELIAVLAILSIALAVIAPSMSRNYDNWRLRSAGQRTVALLRFASDRARRDGIDLAGYYVDHRFVLLRNGQAVKELEIPHSITVRPEKPRSAVFLSTGQIVAAEPFVLENQRGRKVIIEIGPLPGQVRSKETAP